MAACNEDLRRENAAYPRTCARCGLGPCKDYAMVKITKRDLGERIDDLIKQATTERSHYYVASTLLEARDELKRLREIEFRYESVSK